MASSSLPSSARPAAPPAAAAQRLLWLGIAVVAFGSVVVAVGLQHIKGLDPCPLCIIQRYLHLAVAACALGAACTRRVAALVLAVATIAAALGGAAVASHQVWMQQNPIVASCSRQLFELVNDAWLAHWLPALFRGAGDCLANDWALFGLTMPAWSLVLFCAYLIAAWPALVLGRAR
jgi:disulfide bond formation protein DsbB